MQSAELRVKNMAKTEMRPIKDTIPLEEARALIEQASVPIDRRERVRLVDANGRVSAANVESSRDVPPFSRAGSSFSIAVPAT